jgi:hypothetical protein
MRQVLFVLAALTLAYRCAAQDVAPVESHATAQIQPREVVHAREGFRISDKIVFVIDVSGSMAQSANSVPVVGAPPGANEPKHIPGETSRITQGIMATLMILGGTDDAQAAIITFTDSCTRWPGCAECDHPPEEPCDRRCVHWGWALFPKRIQEADQWLSTQSCRGNTEPAAALSAALNLQVEGLTVVFISDGDFKVDPVVEVLTNEQRQRVANGLSEAPILVWGAGPDASRSQSLLRIAELGGGGMWVNGASEAVTATVTGPW